MTTGFSSCVLSSLIHISRPDTFTYSGEAIITPLVLVTVGSIAIN